MENENTKVVSIRLPVPVIEAYEQMAEKVNMTRNKFLSVCLRVGFFIINSAENNPEENERIMSGVIDDVAESVGK